MTPYLLTLASIFIMALIGSLVAKKLGKPSILFYILFGLLFGKLILQTQASRNFMEQVANLGIVLLLFTIGLELPLNKLKRAGKLIITSGFLQITASGLVASLLLFFIVKNIWLAIFIGVAISMSSTAIVAKLLQNKEDTGPTGEITLGVLIIQDIFSVFLITLLSFFVASGSGSMFFLAGLFLLKILVVLVSFYGLNLLFRIFEHLRFSREELSLFTFSILFLLIGLYSRFEIPETTAGFVIGLLLGQKKEHHEIFSQVRVFKDILLVLFFFFLGTYIHHVTIQTILISLILAIIFMVIKFVVAFFILIIQGLHRKTSFWVSFDLMQTGEFAFVLLTILNSGNFITNDIYQLMIMTIAWSLLLFSFVYRSKVKFYRQVTYYVFNRFNFIKKLSSQGNRLIFDQLNFADHIVLCGYGRVGSYIGHGLALSKLPLVVVDTDAREINKLLKKGVKAIYGDATEPEILDYAQVDKAKFLIISVPNWKDQEEIINIAKSINPKIEILTRNHLNQQLRALKAMGVSQVVQPEFEAALTLLKRVLKIYQLDKPEIKKRLQYLKMLYGSSN